MSPVRTVSVLRRIADCAFKKGGVQSRERADLVPPLVRLLQVQILRHRRLPRAPPYFDPPKMLDLLEKLPKTKIRLLQRLQLNLKTLLQKPLRLRYRRLHRK